MEAELIVKEIRYVGATGNVLQVGLSDDSQLFLDTDHPAAAIALDMRDSDDLLNGDQFDALSRADEEYRCRRKSMDLLARAEQCRRGLESKLARKGWSRPAVKVALDRMETAGFLDDRRFAETWVRLRFRTHPEGPSRLIGSLMAKGVNGGIAREAVETILEELGDEAVDQALEQAWEKLSRRSGNTEEKLTSALVRRGFPIGKVRQLIRSREVPE